MVRKIEVFSRHCYFSTISQHKNRFFNFSRFQCYRNLLETIDLSSANLTFILDVAKGGVHFLNQEANHPVIKIREGTEAGAFLKLLQIVEAKNFHPDTILYFVEDDYLHQRGWVQRLFEVMELKGIDYATLYDHKDKYTELYQKLSSKIYVTASNHWRTIPSTTQTFAVRWKTLQEDLQIHRKYSSHCSISADHQKFLALTKKGRTLVSSVPGFSTHVEVEFASPCFDWESTFF